MKHSEGASTWEGDAGDSGAGGDSGGGDGGSDSVACNERAS